MVEDRELLERIDRLNARASFAPEGGRILVEMEDVLAQGYVHALRVEARSRRLAERVEALVEQLDEPEAATELRRISVQRRGLEERAKELRSQLAVMREHFVRLGGG